MNSSVLTKFDKIEYYDDSNELIAVRSVVYSNEIKNEFLGMMNADFAEDELSIKMDLLENSELTLTELEVLSELSLFQSDYEELTEFNKYDSYSTSLGSKLVIVRAPKECIKLVLIDTETNTKYNIEFNSNNQYSVPDVDKVEKMVLITQSGNISYINPSVLIHENSDHPHSNLSHKILTADEFFDIVINNEVEIIDGRIIHSKSGSILGIDQEPYFDITLSTISIDDNNKLLINNKYL